VIFNQSIDFTDGLDLEDDWDDDRSDGFDDGFENDRDDAFDDPWDNDYLVGDEEYDY
jgi:hypothetical protein